MIDTGARVRKPRPIAAVSGLAAASSAVAAGLLYLVQVPLIYLIISAVVIVALATSAAVVDGRSRRLPNALLAPLAAVALIQACVLSIWSGTSTVLLEAVGASAVLGVAYAAMAFAGWVGVGDVKYIAVLGLAVGTFFGWAAIAIAPIAILFAGGHRGLVVIARRDAPRRLPHGPTILVAAAVVTALLSAGLA